MQSYIASPISRKNIRNFTTTIREAFGLSNIAKFPVIQFLEIVMPELYDDFYYEIREEEEMGSCHGLTLPDDNCIIIREDVYQRAIKDIGRDRFTIAHEIGHYFLHKKGQVALARTGQNVKIPAYQDPEWQANTFAAELLMPYDLLKGKTPWEVSSLCEVSHKAAQVQLSKIGYYRF